MPGFKLGELIITCQPYAYVLSNSYRGLRCDYCFKSKDNLKRCSQCTFVCFCDKFCQEKAWEFHKLECKFIKNSKPKEPTAVLRMISLILLKMKRDGDENPCENVYGRKVTFKSLMSHAEEMENDLTKCKQIMGLIGTLRSYIPQSNIPLPSMFMQIFGKMCINSFNICDEEMQGLGTGLYLGASVFDHSCEPDAEVVFNGVDIIIRAVKDIPHRDISKISICYIEQLDLTKDRQNALKEQYYFTCKCSRCLSSDSDELMSKTLVPEDSVKDKLKKFKEGMEQLKKMCDDDKVGSLSLYTAAADQLASQDEILADTHVLKVKTLEIAFNACIKNGQWCDAVVIGRQLIKPYRLFYGPFHPILGVHLYSVGKAETFLSFSSSTKTLGEAEAVLAVTHGKDHPLYKNLTEVIRETLVSDIMSKLTSTN